MSPDEPKVQTLKLTKIIKLPIRVRATPPQSAIVDEYSEKMLAGEKFPPIDVFFDGVTYRLADGEHRFEASSKGNFTDINCNVRSGGEREAMHFSLGSNRGHGVRRTNDDKRHAVTILLRDSEWRGYSDPVLAEIAGVSERLVGKVRKEMTDATPHSAESPDTKIGKDGRKINTRNIGKSRKEEKERSPKAAKGRKPSVADLPTIASTRVEKGKPSLADNMAKERSAPNDPDFLIQAAARVINPFIVFAGDIDRSTIQKCEWAKVETTYLALIVEPGNADIAVLLREVTSATSAVLDRYSMRPMSEENEVSGNQLGLQKHKPSVPDTLTVGEGVVP